MDKIYKMSGASLVTAIREGEAKFLCCSLYNEGAFSIMEPAKFSRISFESKIDFGVRI